MNGNPIIFWFRRDLRIEDNLGFFEALSQGPVLPLFIFDTRILDRLEDKDDQRITFIHQELQRLDAHFTKYGSGLQVEHGKPIEVWRKVLSSRNPKAVYFNEDYTPYARNRDKEIESFLTEREVHVRSFTDHIIQHPTSVLKDDGKAYTVFTPYMKKWKAKLRDEHLDHYPSEDHLTQLYKFDRGGVPSLNSIGFTESTKPIPGRFVQNKLLQQYKEMRDYPGKSGTSKMSPHLRFGTVSTRKLFQLAITHSEAYLNELIWREFYTMVLWNFPESADRNFNRKYDKIPWENNEEHFKLWCEGRTGFPLVDAGMRELLNTGFMHNRVRMVVASFLTKDLLIDWKWGERWFARKLLDYELASNVGGWQWAAGTGVDAAPYFRIFNPVSQQQKFDPDFEYIKKWVPEWGTDDYRQPIIDHKEARKRTLAAFKNALDY